MISTFGTVPLTTDGPGPQQQPHGPFPPLAQPMADELGGAQPYPPGTL